MYIFGIFIKIYLYIYFILIHPVVFFFIISEETNKQTKVRRPSHPCNVMSLSATCFVSNEPTSGHLFLQNIKKKNIGAFEHAIILLMRCR